KRPPRYWESLPRPSSVTGALRKPGCTENSRAVMEARQGKWETVKSLFEAAQGVAPEELSEFLAARCQDPEVCAEVVRLLAEYREAESFLSTPAVGRISTAPLDEALRFAPGEILAGRFKVVEFIAAGGMGVV